MAADTFRSWNVRAIVIARVFLATALLLRTLDWVSHVTLYAELVFLFELLLGAAIAVGWLMRYAAAIVFLGDHRGGRADTTFSSRSSSGPSRNDCCTVGCQWHPRVLWPEH